MPNRGTRRATNQQKQPRTNEAGTQRQPNKVVGNKSQPNQRQHTAGTVAPRPPPLTIRPAQESIITSTTVKPSPSSKEQEQRNRIRQDEVEVLASIFEGDFEVLKPVWGQVSFRISSVKPFPGDPERNKVSCNLVVIYTNEYPAKPPMLRLDNVVGLSHEITRLLLVQLEQDAARRSESQPDDPYVLDLVMFAREFLVEHNHAQSESFHQEYLEHQKKKHGQIHNFTAGNKSVASSVAISEPDSSFERQTKNPGTMLPMTNEVSPASVVAAQSTALHAATQVLAPHEGPRQGGLLTKRSTAPAAATQPVKPVDLDDVWRASAQFGSKSRYRCDFEELEELGRGGFGEVVKARNRLDGNTYAVKRVKLERNDDSLNRKILREVTSLAKMFHHNIVRYYQAWIEDDDTDDNDRDSSPDEFNGTTSEEDSSSDGEDDPSSGFDANGLAHDPLNELRAGSPLHQDDGDLGFDFYAYSHGWSDEDDDGDSANAGDNVNDDELIEEEGSLQYSKPSSSQTNGKASSSSSAWKTDTKTSTSGWGGLSKGLGAWETETSSSKDPSSTIDENKTNSSATRANNSSTVVRKVLYIQMECCDGLTLREAIDKGLYQDQAQVMRLFRQLVEALFYVHSSAGLIHRDLKPENVFLQNGIVKLGDFGLATERLGIHAELSEDNSTRPNSAHRKPSRVSEHKHSKVSKHPHGGFTEGVGTSLYRAPEVLQSLPAPRGLSTGMAAAVAAVASASRGGITPSRPTSIAARSRQGLALGVGRIVGLDQQQHSSGHSLSAHEQADGSGGGKRIVDGRRGSKTTPGPVAPYDQKCDMWSLGMVLFEMLCPPFTTGMERFQVLTALRTSFTLPSGFEDRVPRELVEILRRLIQINPAARMSSRELLESSLLPYRIETEEAYFEEVLQAIRTAAPSSAIYSRLIDALFHQQQKTELVHRFELSSDAIGYGYRPPSSTVISAFVTGGARNASATSTSKRKAQVHRHHNRPHLEQLLTAGTLVPSFVVPETKTRNIGAIVARLQRLFERCGAVPLDTPLLVPGGEKLSGISGDVHAPTTLKLLNDQGMVVELPSSLTIPFARWAALRGVRWLTRYSVDQVYAPAEGGGQPRSRTEASFDTLADHGALASQTSMELNTLISATETLVELRLVDMSKTIFGSHLHGKTTHLMNPASQATSNSFAGGSTTTSSGNNSHSGGNTAHNVPSAGTSTLGGGSNTNSHHHQSTGGSSTRSPKLHASGTARETVSHSNLHPMISSPVQCQVFNSRIQDAILTICDIPMNQRPPLLVLLSGALQRNEHWSALRKQLVEDLKLTHKQADELRAFVVAAQSAISPSAQKEAQKTSQKAAESNAQKNARNSRQHKSPTLRSGNNKNKKGYLHHAAASGIHAALLTLGDFEVEIASRRRKLKEQDGMNPDLKRTIRHHCDAAQQGIRSLIDLLHMVCEASVLPKSQRDTNSNASASGGQSNQPYNSPSSTMGASSNDPNTNAYHPSSGTGSSSAAGTSAGSGNIYGDLDAAQSIVAEYVAQLGITPLTLCANILNHSIQYQPWLLTRSDEFQSGLFFRFFVRSRSETGKSTQSNRTGNNSVFSPSSNAQAGRARTKQQKAAATRASKQAKYVQIADGGRYDDLVERFRVSSLPPAFRGGAATVTQPEHKVLAIGVRFHVDRISRLVSDITSDAPFIHALVATPSDEVEAMGYIDLRTSADGRLCSGNPESEAMEREQRNASVAAMERMEIAGILRSAGLSAEWVHSNHHTADMLMEQCRSRRIMFLVVTKRGFHQFSNPAVRSQMVRIRSVYGVYLGPQAVDKETRLSTLPSVLFNLLSKHHQSQR